MELWYIWKFMLGGSLRNLLALLTRNREYKQSRGTALYNDVKDWLGVWPIEFAKREDVKDWAKRNGLEMLKMKTGEANTEYLFEQPTGQNQWPEL
jgi:2-polyprenyl-6-hydroxyphenyl methylase/3-demethylubiquinone-9 3-methyltransferase